jgi:hypothetical protein
LSLALSACTGSVKHAADVSKGEAKIQLTGKDFSAWRENTGTWQIAGEATMDPKNKKLITTKPGSGVMVSDGKTVYLFSKEESGDLKAHIEFMVPRGSNSGVYFMGRYEIQIFDSWAVKKPKFSDCSGIYQRWDENRKPKGYEGSPPRVNASLPPGQWQSFDVIFRAPRPEAKSHRRQNFSKKNAHCSGSHFERFDAGEKLTTGQKIIDSTLPENNGGLC